MARCPEDRDRQLTWRIGQQGDAEQRAQLGVTQRSGAQLLAGRHTPHTHTCFFSLGGRSGGKKPSSASAQACLSCTMRTRIRGGSSRYSWNRRSWAAAGRGRGAGVGWGVGEGWCGF